MRCSTSQDVAHTWAVLKQTTATSAWAHLWWPRHHRCGKPTSITTVTSHIVPIPPLSARRNPNLTLLRPFSDLFPPKHRSLWCIFNGVAPGNQGRDLGVRGAYSGTRGALLKIPLRSFDGEGIAASNNRARFPKIRLFFEK